MEAVMEINYPLAVALEKAGYSILSLECVMKNVYDTEQGKSVPSPVLSLYVTPANGAKMLFVDNSAKAP